MWLYTRRDRASLQLGLVGVAPQMSQGAQFFAIARATAPDAAPHRLISVCELLLAAGAQRLEDLRDVEESDVTGLDALSPRHRRVATQLITAANRPAAFVRSNGQGQRPFCRDGLWPARRVGFVLGSVWGSRGMAPAWPIRRVDPRPARRVGFFSGSV